MEKGESNVSQAVPKKSKLWIWIVVGVVIILIAGTSFYFYKASSTEEFGNVQDLNPSDTRRAIEDAFGKETCFDSDDGKNSSVRGYTITYMTDQGSSEEVMSSGSFSKVFDYCVDSLDDGMDVMSSKYLIEKWCDGDSTVSSVLECENLCENGACIE